MPLRLRSLLITVLVSVTVLSFSVTSAQTRSGGNAYNATDAAFAAMMLPHHEGGIRLGDTAAKKGDDSDVRRLGRAIESKQNREAGTLRRLVSRFRTKKAVPPTEMERRDAIDMTRLRVASGRAFDREWLNVISAHHSAAIQMAQIEVRGGRNQAARQLARQIVATQRRELGEFNRITTRLGG